MELLSDVLECQIYGAGIEGIQYCKDDQFYARFIRIKMQGG